MTEREDLIRYFAAIRHWKGSVDFRVNAAEREMGSSGSGAPDGAAMMALAALIRAAVVSWRAIEPPVAAAAAHREFGVLLEEETRCLEAVARSGPANATAAEMEALTQVVVQLGAASTALQQRAADAGVVLDFGDDGLDETRRP